MPRFDQSHAELAEFKDLAVSRNDNLVLRNPGAARDVGGRLGTDNRGARALRNGTDVHGMVEVRVHGNDRREPAHAELVQHVVDGRRVVGHRPAQDPIGQARPREEAVDENLGLAVVD